VYRSIVNRRERRSRVFAESCHNSERPIFNGLYLPAYLYLFKHPLVKKTLCIVLIAGSLSSCGDPKTETDSNANTALLTPPPAVLQYSVIKVYPHDTASYTQGLIWQNNHLIEGTGEPGFSKLRNIDLQTGKPEKEISLGAEYFGEGVTLFNNKIYQLTWKEHKVFVYDPVTFKKLQEFEWTYEGWGLTHNGKQLIVSTGGSNIYFVNPETFKIERTLGVTDNNGYVSMINELEFVDGKIYANIYETDYIVRINPETGVVEARADLSDFLKQTGATYDPRTVNPGYVLNGIAYNAEKKTFYITGKRWPVLAEVKFN
jgi:glutamine cyclotransferase